MGQLAKATKGASLQKSSTTGDVQEMIQKNWPRIAAVAPKHLNPERLMQIAISSINKNPKLAECTPASLLSALMTCSALGLEPSDVDGLGQAFLVPFKNKKSDKTEVQFVLGYKGMLRLARRSRQLKSIVARGVFEGDFFDYTFGTSERIEHIPSAIDRSPQKLTHVYLVANLLDGGQHIDVMTKAQVEAHRKRSSSPNSPSWLNDYEAMAEKTIIRANFKYLPVSTEEQSAVEQDGTPGPYIAQIDPDYPIDLEPVEPENPLPEPHDEQVDDGWVKVICKSCGATRTLTADVTPDDLKVIKCTACFEEGTLDYIKDET